MEIMGEIVGGRGEVVGELVGGRGEVVGELVGRSRTCTTPPSASAEGAAGGRQISMVALGESTRMPAAGACNQAQSDGCGRMQSGAIRHGGRRAHAIRRNQTRSDAGCGRKCTGEETDTDHGEIMGDYGRSWEIMGEHR